jgi:hypothetical protein
VHQGAVREVVLPLGQPLQHRPHAHHMGGAVHRVVLDQGLLSYVICSLIAGRLGQPRVRIKRRSVAGRP